MNNSRARAADAVKKFLEGSRTGVRGHLDPAMESKLWALLTPESGLSKEALVQRAAEDEEFKVVWEYCKSRKPSEAKAADLVRRTFLRKGK